jgi:exoribonuclease-2
MVSASAGAEESTAWSARVSRDEPINLPSGELMSIARRAMVERGLLPDFSPAVLAETEAITEASSEMGPHIRDLADCFGLRSTTGTPATSTSFRSPNPGGRAVKILVAIADVDALVKKGSAIDEHARQNTTSVYTAGGIFPMLPGGCRPISHRLAQEDRLAIVMETAVGADGLTESDVYRALVLSHAKLAYDSVAAWLDGTAPAPPRVAAVPGLDEQLRLQDRVAQRMKLLRTRHGALGLETIEARPVFDGGVLTALRPDEKNRAKALIEDFMIAANGVTARYLDRKGFPSFRRVLRTPERWPRIVELGAAMGERLPAEPSALALEEFLTKRRRSDPAGFPDVSLSVI